MSDPPVTQGVHHVGLTVPNLERARAFFLDTLGFRQVGAKPEYPAAFVSDGQVMITLWQAAEPEHALPFDRRNHIGLHHLALRITDRAALDALHDGAVVHAHAGRIAISTDSFVVRPIFFPAGY